MEATIFDRFQSPSEVSDVLRHLSMFLKIQIMFQSPSEVSDVLSS